MPKEPYITGKLYACFARAVFLPPSGMPKEPYITLEKRHTNALAALRVACVITSDFSFGVDMSRG